VQLGVEVARKHGESAAVINCIEAHHDDVAHDSVESVLVQASDAISGSRPGARREAFESYVKRLTKLEEIAGGYPGVDKTTVIQAGREVRVIVKPDQINDSDAQLLSETIARRIENELQYPGQIRVTVIRETRASDIAK
ncbi:MAG TPA: ribonuclease Y, partial [Gemmatimonadales bacterium]|jgi:ribonuclease Y